MIPENEKEEIIEKVANETLAMIYQLALSDDEMLAMFEGMQIVGNTIESWKLTREQRVTDSTLLAIFAFMLKAGEATGQELKKRGYDYETD